MTFLNVIKEMSVNQDNEIALSEIEFTFVGVPMWINFKVLKQCI